MLTMVEVYDAQGEVLALPLQDISAGYLVKDIDGLDPVKATIVSSTFAQLDGTEYQSSHRENRNIVLTLGIESYYGIASVRELRGKLYSFFMPKRYLTLRFYIDGVHFVDISGRVESFVTPLFSKEPEVVISVLCFNPDFVAPSSVVVDGSTKPGLTEQIISYPGSVETGFVFRLMLDRALSEFIFYNRPSSGDLMALEFVAPLSAGDVLEISTIPRAKRAYLTRSGSQSSILYGVSPASAWVKLFPGENNVRVLAEGVPIPFTIEYLAKYGGL